MRAAALLCVCLLAVLVVPEPEGRKFRIVFPRNGTSVSVPPGGLQLRFDIEGYAADDRRRLQVCLGDACLPYPFTQQPYLTAPGDRPYILRARLLAVDRDAAADGAIGHELARDTSSFITFASGVVVSEAREAAEQSGWREASFPLLDLHALREPNAALLEARDRFAHLVHDTRYELHEPAAGGGGSGTGTVLSGHAPHRSDMAAPAGQEPYLLLASLALQLRNTTIVDLGTHYGVSALTLAGAGQSNGGGNRVVSYDISDREAVIAGYNGLTRAELRRELNGAVRFTTRDAMRELRDIARAPLISLDTAHLPDTVPFEREFMQALEGVDYRGVVVCDDIHMNAEMVRWWHEIPQRKFDVTSVGHGQSGTGVVDFSGRLRVVGAVAKAGEPSSSAAAAAAADGAGWGTPQEIGVAPP